MSDDKAVAGNANDIQPFYQVSLQARVGQGELHFRSSDLGEVAKVMAYFNLVPVPPQADMPSTADKPAEAAAPKARQRAPKAQEQQQQQQKQETASTAPEAAGTQSKADEPAASVSPQEAADAVRAYGAKHGIAKARELLKKYGFERTTDITTEKAAALHGEATAEASEEL